MGGGGRLQGQKYRTYPESAMIKDLKMAMIMLSASLLLELMNIVRDRLMILAFQVLLQYV